MRFPSRIVCSAFTTLTACFLGLATLPTVQAQSAAPAASGAAAAPPSASPQMLKSADFMIALNRLPSYSYFAYSDGNGRNVANLQLLYRILPSPKQAMPLFRVGLQYQYDGTNHAAKTYFAPVNYQSLSLAANYTQLTRRLSYGMVGALPVTGESGSPGGRYGPAKRLFTFASYHLTDPLELWFKFTDTSAPHGSPSITDFLFGINQRI